MTDEFANADAPLEVSPLDEQLSAYLDHELPPDESRKVEQLLAIDPQVRSRLHSLELGWEALDRLEATPLSERFTHTTMEMVTVAADADLAATCAALPQQRRRRGLRIGASLAAALAVGFGLVALLRPDPDRALLEALPVLERLEQYRQVREDDFLRRLTAEHLFDEERSTASEATPPGDETLAQRRARVEALTSADKEDLRRRLELYESLDAAEKQRLHQLHQDLDRDPQAGQLRGAMERYYKWFAALPPFRRAELMSLSGNDRINKVKSLLAEQHQKLTPEDLIGLRRWLEQVAARFDEKAVLQNIPEKSRRFLEKATPGERRRMIAMMALNARPGMIKDQDLVELRSYLTAETRQRLEAKSPGEQLQIVADSLRLAFHQQLASAGSKSPWAQLEDTELAKYFETGLTPEQRDRLLILPADEMQRELRQMYLVHSKGPDALERWSGRTGLSKRGPTGDGDKPHAGRVKKGTGGLSGPRPRDDKPREKLPEPK